MFRKLFTIISITLLFSSLAQSLMANETLLLIGGQPVSSEEFNYIYKKNNVNNTADYSRKSLEDYLELFINYKLKVRQALDLGMDTLSDLMSEYKGYEQQLYDAHINKTIVDPLVKQEYERSKFDIGVSHIFLSKDTPGAAAKIKEIHGQLKKGITFEKLAKENSEDKNSAEQGGRIGYFTAQQIGYPQLEDAVYNTPVGKYSNPIETAIGYHIIKVFDKRPARGRIRVAIIRKAIPQDSLENVQVKLLMDSLHKAVTTGSNFGDLAIKFSDDQMTNMRAGEMDWFGINQYTQVFEDAAFALKKDGEISKPIKTSSAYYIIKRLMATSQLTFEEAEPVIKAKLLKSRMYTEAMDKLQNEVKTSYQYKEYPEELAKFKTRMETYVNIYPFKYVDEENPQILLEIDGKAYNANQFGKVMNTIATKVVGKTGAERSKAIFDETLKAIVSEAHKNNLPSQNPEYKGLLEEYRNGVLIFELTKNTIWNRAVTDSSGLADFFAQHRSKYQWNRKAVVKKFVLPDNASAEMITSLSAENRPVTMDDWKKFFAQKGIQAEVKEMVLEDKVSEEASQISWQLGFGQPVSKSNQVILYEVIELKQPSQKELSECKGYVIADFQESLEKKWIADLRAIYPVELKKDVFEKMIKK